MKRQLFSLGAILAVTAVGSNVAFDASELGLSGGDHEITFKTAEDLDAFYNLSPEEQVDELNFESSGVNLLMSDSSQGLSQLLFDANFTGISEGETTVTYSAYTNAGLDVEEVEVHYANDAVVDANEKAQFIGGVDQIEINSKEELQSFYDMNADEQLREFGIVASGMSLVTTDAKIGEVSDLYTDVMYNGATSGSAKLEFTGYGTDNSYTVKAVTLNFNLNV